MLSADTIATVKSTVPLLQQHGRQITQEFYGRLFKQHPELQNIFNMSNQRSGRQSTALADAALAYAMNIDNLAALLPAVQRIASKHASLGVLPAHYPVVGENLLAAIQEVLGLPADHAALKAWGEAYGVLAKVFVDAEEGLYQAAESADGGWRGFRAFEIRAIERESALVQSFLLYPADGKALPAYKGGQYIGIKLKNTASGHDEIRQYSLSDWGQEGYFRISVKAEDGGVASNQLHQAKVGDQVLLSPPQGDFVLNEQAPAQVFIAGGVGITPLYSMMKQALALRNNGQKLTFIACSKNAELQVFAHELREMAKLPNVTVKFAFEYGEGGDVAGYLTEPVLNEWISDRNAQVYFCGPLPFMAALQSILRDGLKLPEAQLSHEVFGPTVAI